MLPEPQFLATDTGPIFASILADYEARAGRSVQPTQPEYLLLQSITYQLGLQAAAVNAGAKQNLVDFAPYPILDYLGQLVGVQRLAATSARCAMRYTLTPGHTGVIIPEGHRVQSRDGKMFFRPQVNTVVAPGVTVADVDVVANVAGSDGNGYLAGQVDTILDPLPFILSAANTTTSAGGAAQETDVQLRERVKLAPGQFSTAGARASYAFWARTAHPSIIDVGVRGPNDGGTAGEVHLYVLTDTGAASPTILDLVLASASAEDRVPLTDTVRVFAPTPINYAIDARLTVFSDAIPSATIQAVADALTALTTSKARRLGQDVTLDMLTRECMLDRVYSVEFNGLSADVVVGVNQYANCTGINVSIVATTNG